MWTAESGTDALTPLALAAVSTERIKLGTAIVLAFPRSPMVTAYMSWDLARASKGRFILGLGTQVKGHIERRFSTPWLPPVPRMREYVQSLRAIFKCWSEGGKKLSYQGKYYNFSLMTPGFTPAAARLREHPDLHLGAEQVHVPTGRRVVRRLPHPSVSYPQVSARDT